MKCQSSKKVLKTEWKKKSIKAADFMTSTITAPIQAKLTKNGFNNRYKMYKRLKELLHPSGKTQFMGLS